MSSDQLCIYKITQTLHYKLMGTSLKSSYIKDCYIRIILKTKKRTINESRKNILMSKIQQSNTKCLKYMFPW